MSMSVGHEHSKLYARHMLQVVMVDLPSNRVTYIDLPSWVVSSASASLDTCTPDPPDVPSLNASGLAPDPYTRFAVTEVEGEPIAITITCP